MRLACGFVVALIGVGLMAAVERGAAAAPVVGPARDGLVLGIEVVDAQRPVVALVLRNVSDHDITVRSHIATHETQYDWFEIAARCRRGCPRGAARVRRIGLTDSRDKSGPVNATLAPGAELRHEIDLGDWAARGVNGGHALTAGDWDLSATYRVAGEPRVWNGALASGTARLHR